MTKFNPENKETLTYGECLHPAMKITDVEDAKQYLDAYVEYTQKHLDKDPKNDNKTALDIVKANLGYFAGYYDNETRGRVEKLFCCSHPIFGKEVPTNEEAFECGKQGKSLSELRALNGL
jgi:hypothetical protein